MLAIHRAALVASRRVSLHPIAATAISARTLAAGRPIDKIICSDHETIFSMWNEFKKTYKEAASQLSSGSASAGSTPRERARSSQGMPHNVGEGSAESSTLTYGGRGSQFTTGAENTRQSTSAGDQSPAVPGMSEPIPMSEESRGKLTRIKNSLLREIAVHSVAEEIVVYPELRRFRGDEAANRLIEDQQEVKDECFAIDRMAVDDVDLMPRLTKVMKNLQLHTAQEENVELPELRARLDDSWLMSLGQRFEMLKHTVPTRAHPSAPTEPLSEALVGMMTAPLDKLRDLGRDFASDADIKVGQLSSKSKR